MFEDIMHNHVGLPHLLPAPEKNSSNNDLVENDDDQIVSESSHSTGFHKFHFANIKKYSKNRNTMSFQNFEKFRLKKQPLVRPTTKKPLLRPTKPNMLRPAVHKSQHHSSIASRQQSLVSSVSDSERYVHALPVLTSFHFWNFQPPHVNLANISCLLIIGIHLHPTYVVLLH